MKQQIRSEPVFDMGSHNSSHKNESETLLHYDNDNDNDNDNNNDGDGIYNHQRHNINRKISTDGDIDEDELYFNDCNHTIHPSHFLFQKQSHKASNSGGGGGNSSDMSDYNYNNVPSPQIIRQSQTYTHGLTDSGGGGGGASVGGASVGGASVGGASVGGASVGSTNEYEMSLLQKQQTQHSDGGGVLISAAHNKKNKATHGKIRKDNKNNNTNIISKQPNLNKKKSNSLTELHTPQSQDSNMGNVFHSHSLRIQNVAMEAAKAKAKANANANANNNNSDSNNNPKKLNVIKNIKNNKNMVGNTQRIHYFSQTPKPPKQQPTAVMRGYLKKIRTPMPLKSELYNMGKDDGNGKGKENGNGNGNGNGKGSEEVSEKGLQDRDELKPSQTQKENDLTIKNQSNKGIFVFLNDLICFDLFYFALF